MTTKKKGSVLNTAAWFLTELGPMDRDKLHFLSYFTQAWSSSCSINLQGGNPHLQFYESISVPKTGDGIEIENLTKIFDNKKINPVEKILKVGRLDYLSSEDIVVVKTIFNNYRDIENPELFELITKTEPYQNTIANRNRHKLPCNPKERVIDVDELRLFYSQILRKGIQNMTGSSRNE